MWHEDSKLSASNQMLQLDKQAKSTNEQSGEPKKDPYYFTFFNEKNEGGDKAAGSSTKKERTVPKKDTNPLLETSIHTEHSNEDTLQSKKPKAPLKP